MAYFFFAVSYYISAEIQFHNMHTAENCYVGQKRSITFERISAA